MMHYHWGSNIPGYLPMADEPNTAQSWEGARAALLDDMSREAESCYAMDDDETIATGVATDVAMGEVRRWETGQDIYVNNATDRPHDLGVAYWLIACNEQDCEVEE